MRRPKLIVILLASGIIVLIMGSVVAASLPSRPSQTASVALAALAARTHRPARTAVSVPLSQSAGFKLHKTPRAKKHQVKHTITYVVKPGDTLSGIAEWFMLHGYGALYAANEDVIGANPNLILPGESITITNGVMKLSRAHS